MSDDVLILGSTDTTLAVADAATAQGIRVAAIAHTGATFSISYAPGGVRNARAADIPGWCARHHAREIAFENFRSLESALGDHQFSACLVAGWHHKVPRTFRARFGDRCVGYHASLLPALRGGAPLNWAILAGLEETGVSLFVLGDGVDDGPIYGQERFAVGSGSYVSDLVDASAAASVALTRRYLPGIVSGLATPAPQVGDPSYGLQRSPEDGRVDWSRAATDIHRLVRAVSRPYAGAKTRFGDRELAIHRAAVMSNVPTILGSPGQIAAISGIPAPVIVCGEGALAIEEAVFEGGESAIQFLQDSSNQRLGRRP